MINKEKLAARLRKEEGLEFLPYKCSAGHWTIGYGHLLSRGISKEAAEFILQEDIAIAEKQVKNSFTFYKNLNEARQNVLVDMCFNIGITSLSGFKKMLASVQSADYARAADEMLASKWARQVGKRAIELAEIMRSGKW